MQSLYINPGWLISAPKEHIKYKSSICGGYYCTSVRFFLLSVFNYYASTYSFFINLISNLYFFHCCWKFPNIWNTFVSTCDNYCYLIGLYFRTCGSRNQLFASLSFSFILISLFLINFLLSFIFSSINVICGTSLIALSPFVGWIFRNLTLSSLAPLSLLVLNITNFISFEVVNQLAGRNVSYRIAVLYFILSFLLNQNLKINILSLASQKPISILNWSFILYFFIRTFSSGSRGGIFTLFL